MNPLNSPEAPEVVQQPVKVKAPSGFEKIFLRIIRLAVLVWVGIIVFGLIQSFVENRKDYPGKADFGQANDKIDRNTAGAAHGNSELAQQVAAKFAKNIRALQAGLFTGGSSVTVFTGGEFVTYCRHNPESIALLVHVPQLRSYKDDKTRQLLARLAWTTANDVARDLPFTNGTPTLILGLRGIGAYGPIWSGKLGGEPELMTDDTREMRRLYPFFLPASELK